MPNQKLSAVALKNELWDTMLQVKGGHLDPAAADSIATQARERIKTSYEQAARAYDKILAERGKQ